MGVRRLLGGGAPKSPSAQELQAQQEAAARAERDKMALEQAGREASAQKQMAAARDSQSNRVYAAGTLEEDTGRKRFLKGI